jgi:hypothetical protein
MQRVEIKNAPMPADDVRELEQQMDALAREYAATHERLWIQAGEEAIRL